jgi:hypothetical protein
VSSCEIEQLIEELRRLVGWQATPHRLASLANLRYALGIAEDLPYLRAGRLMRRELLVRIRALDGTYTIAKKPCDALSVRLALQVSFGYDKSGADAPTRRVAAIGHLGLCYSIHTWRRDTGGEVALLSILAEALTMPVAVQTSK